MDNLLGLHTYADILIRKSGYWTRVDGSKWWRNPKSHAIEPYNSPTPSVETSPKSKLKQLPEKARKIVESNPNSGLGNAINRFHELPPEHQANVLDTLESPARTIVASTDIGRTLGINLGAGGGDLKEPLSHKLFETLAYTQLPLEVSAAKAVLWNSAESVVYPLIRVVTGIFGEEAEHIFDGVVGELHAKLDKAIHTAGETHSGIRTKDVDHGSLGAAVKEFEDGFFEKLDQLIDR